MPNEELQRKFIHFQILQNTLHELKERESVILQNMHEISATKEALENLKSIKPGSETLIQIGNNSFVTGSIKDSERVLIGIGGGVAIQKSREDAIKLMERRQDEASKALTETQKDAKKISTEMQSLQPEIERLAKEEKKQA